MERIRVCVVQPLLWAIGWRQRCASSSHPEDLGPHSPWRACVLPAGWLIARSSLRNCPWTREAALLRGQVDVVPDPMPPSGISLKSRSSFRAPHGIGLDFCGHCFTVSAPLCPIPLPSFAFSSCAQQDTPINFRLRVCFHGAPLGKLVPGVILGNRIWGMMPPTEWQ